MTTSYQSSLQEVTSNCEKYFNSIREEFIIPICKKHSISFEAGIANTDSYWNFYWNLTLDNGNIIEERLWETYPEECDGWMNNEDYNEMQNVAAILNADFFGSKIGYLVKSFKFQEV